MTFYRKSLLAFTMAGSVVIGAVAPLPSNAQPAILTNFKSNPSTSQLPDFSFAGYRGGPVDPPTVSGPIFRVQDYGAVPNDGKDDIAAIQKAINAAEYAGGGVVLFPAGTFDFDVTTTQRYLRIRNSNVVLRGAGSGTTGTILHDHAYSQGPDPVNAPYRANEAPSFVHVGVRETSAASNTFDPTVSPWAPLTTVNPAARNAKSITVANASVLKVGETYMLTQKEASDMSLAKSLASPLTSFSSNHSATSGRNAYKFRQLVTIKSISGSTVTLDGPIRWELRSTWTPELWAAPIIREIGIENLRLKTDWAGPFCHHCNVESDDGWNHLRFDWVENCWVRNVVHDGTTMAVGIFSGKNCLVTDCSITGPKGHNGFNAVGATTSCLFRNLNGATAFHTWQIQFYASGNVFKNSSSSEPSAFDAHGGFSIANLLDVISGGVFRCGGSGAWVPPNAGRGTTFWNWRVGTQSPYSTTESVVFAEANRIPGFIGVGVRGINGQTVKYLNNAGSSSSSNVNASWGYVESIGTAVTPTSLYDDQFAFRTGGDHPPYAIISSPLSGTSYTAPASISITANATDDKGVGKVEFFSGSTLLGSDISSPYNLTWSGVGVGKYSLTAKVTDSNSISSVSTPVSVAVNSSFNGYVLNPTADAFVQDGTHANSNFGSAGSLETKKSDVNNGENRRSYLKFDLSSVSGTISSAKLRLFGAYTGNGSPVPTYISPVTVDSWTESGVTWNNQPAGGTALSSLTVGATYQYWEWDVTSFVQSQKSGGDNIISLQVRNDAWVKVKNDFNSREVGSQRPELVIVTSGGTVNPGPTVSLTSPASGQTYTAPANVGTSANASDSNGTITKVDFLSGSTLLGSDSTSPYAITWSNVAAGNYSLTAKATDNGAASTTSTAVSIVVNNSSSSSSGTPTGSLTGTKGTQPVSLSLNTEGTRDWAHWGLNAATDYNHKSGVTSQISNITKIGTATLNRYTDGTMANSWTGGTPTASATSTKAGVYVAGVNNGFQITVPADTTSRTLRVYCGLWKSQGKLEATLSDGSAPAFLDTSHGSTTGSANTMFTLNYKASSAGQSLTVKWTVQTSHDTSGAGTVGWQAATLQ